MYAVTSVAWIQKGVAKSRPTKAEINEEELKRFAQELNGVELNEERNEEDDSEDDECASGLAALSFYSSNADDPYLSRDDPDSDEDEAIIDVQDNVIAVSRVKDEEFCLEAWVYNETQKYIYCHHDYILSSCPIVVEWVGFGRGENSAGNLVAVGTMSPDIEIWNFDVMNTIDPVLILAGSRSGKKKCPEKKKRKVATDGHTDAVLGLSWNKLQQQVLASASADSCVGIWDLEQSSCVLIKSLHSDKVQAVQWHPYESQMLLSGSYDHHAKLVDCRSPEGSQKSWKLAGEVEKVLWNSHSASSFFASTDTGHVYCYDIRAEEPLFELKAHTSAVTSVTLSPSVEGCLVTSSEDQSIKVWDVRPDIPKLVDQKKCKIGALFCSAVCPDSLLLLCVGGEREMRVIDMKNDEKFIACFNAQNVTQQETADVWHADHGEANEKTAAMPSSSQQTGDSATAGSSSKKLAKKSSSVLKKKKKLLKPKKQ